MHELRTRTERRLAPWMFAASLAFLFCLAALTHASSFAPHGEGHTWSEAARWSLWGIVLLYPLFVIETLFYWATGSRVWKRHLLYCILPPCRLGAKDHGTGRAIWLPLVGWAEIDHDLRSRVEKGATVPMIIIALMVLPLIGIEFLERAHEDSQLRFLAGIGSAVIWFAFAFEFTVMISIVDNKLRYCKQHWINLAIIILPVFQFLSGTLLGIARLSRLVRLQQLSRMARVYRMRGLLMRAWRAVLLFEILDRVLRKTPEQRIARLKRILAEREIEIESLRNEIRQLETIAARDKDQAEATQSTEAA